MAEAPPRRMIQFRDGARQFSFRIAGAAIEDGFVLLQNFQWFENTVECLRAANVMPGFLIDGLAAAPGGTRHLIWRDPVRGMP